MVTLRTIFEEEDACFSKHQLCPPDAQSVELAYWDSEGGAQVRVRGEMEYLDDLALKKKIVNEAFTFLKPVVEQHGYDVLALFRLSNGTSIVWRTTQGHSPPEIATF